MADPIIVAAAYVLLAGHPQAAQVPQTVTPIICQLPPAPPINCASGWDHDCKPLGHLTVRLDHRPPPPPMWHHHRPRPHRHWHR